MNVRRTKLLLWTLTAVASALALVTAAWALLTPVALEPHAGLGASAKTRITTQGTPDSQLPLESFQRIWSLQLRKPLDGASATAQSDQTAPTQTTASGPFVLVGTIGNSLAMIRSNTGAVEVKAVGEQVNGAKILAIRPMQVDVEIAGARVTIVKPREGSGG